MKVTIDQLEAIDRWLQTCRTSRGFGGPVVHWWESCLSYTGAMSDWRYEGIMCGYLNLHEKTNDARWLDKAISAGQDLLASQKPDGRFECSSFQRGPMPGGTPHEAAADIALLELARRLRNLGNEDWKKYAAAARRNIDQYQIGKLASSEGFIDQPRSKLIVSNKNATTMEALILAEEVCECNYKIYIDRALNAVMSGQSSRTETCGADVHAGTPPHYLATGIYTARSLSSILRLCRSSKNPELESYVEKSIGFLRNIVTQQGTEFGIAINGARIRCPNWISGSGDILRVFLEYEEIMRKEIPETDALASVLLKSQKPNGSFPTAKGFARLGSGTTWAGRNEFRDILPVAGWIDKVFRALSKMVVVDRDSFCYLPTVVESCSWFGKRCTCEETEHYLELKDAEGRVLYHWTKGESIARVNNLSPI